MRLGRGHDMHPNRLQEPGLGGEIASQLLDYSARLGPRDVSHVSSPKMLQLPPGRIPLRGPAGAGRGAESPGAAGAAAGPAPGGMAPGGGPAAARPLAIMLLSRSFETNDVRSGNDCRQMNLMPSSSTERVVKLGARNGLMAAAVGSLAASILKTMPVLSVAPGAPGWP